MNALGTFQHLFLGALFAAVRGDASPGPLAGLVAQPGFAVYRNTAMKGCIDALQANYPCVARLVGEEWFRAAASVYVPDHLPESPVLATYGESFATFLDRFPPAQELPYLAGVARLDRAWTEAHVAADEPALDPYALGLMDDEALASTCVRPHASARWHWFDAAPIFTIWQRNRNPDSGLDAEIDWKGEGALIVRHQGVVTWIELDQARLALLGACARGATLAEAAGEVLSADPDCDPSAVVDPLLACGAFAALDPKRVESNREEAPTIEGEDA